MTMKTFQKLLALLLTLALLGAALSACASGKETPPAGGGQPDDGQTGAEGAAGDDGAAPDEMTNIRFLFDDSRSCADFGERIVEKINAITEPELGVHVAIDYVSSGDFKTKTIVALAGGDVYDLMSVNPRLPLANLYASSVLTDITQLLPEWAPDTHALIGQYLPACSYDGRVYCIPTLRSYQTNTYLGMRKDVLDDAGLTEQAQAVAGWDDFEKILEAVHAVRPDLYFCQGPSYMLNYSVGVRGETDRFADSLPSYVKDANWLVYASTDGVVTNHAVTPGYLADCQMMARWMERGYVYPDAPFSEESGYDLIKQGIGFAVEFNGEYGTEVAFRDKTGYDCVLVEVCKGSITTDVPNTWALGVPITAEEPEAALRFVNLLYTNSDVMNLFVRGEEGVDYDLVDGEVVYREDPVYKNYDWGVGNQLILTPIAGNGANFYEEVAKLNAAAETSPFLGFVLDVSELEFLVGQISSVYDKYRKSMEYGLYTDEDYQKFCTELETAGMQEYLQGIQAQLDAWRAQQ